MRKLPEDERFKEINHQHADTYLQALHVLGRDVSVRTGEVRHDDDTISAPQHQSSNSLRQEDFKYFDTNVVETYWRQVHQSS